MSKSILLGFLGFVVGLVAGFLVFGIGGFVTSILLAQLFAWQPALAGIFMVVLLLLVAVVSGFTGGLVAGARAPMKSLALTTFSLLLIPALAFLCIENAGGLVGIGVAVFSAAACIMSFRAGSEYHQ